MPRRASASRNRNSISAFMLRSSVCASFRIAVQTPGSTRNVKAFLSAMLGGCRSCFRACDGGESGAVQGASPGAYREYVEGVWGGRASDGARAVLASGDEPAGDTEDEPQREAD